MEARGIWALAETVEQLLDEYQRCYEERKRTSSLPYQIRAYIQAAYADPELNVNQVADHFYVTPTYATRAFKQTFGTGILSYIHTVRVEQAKALLNSSRTVKTVAAMVGFDSPALFIRNFKKIEGVTPARFSGASQRRRTDMTQGEAGA